MESYPSKELIKWIFKLENNEFFDDLLAEHAIQQQA
jgi:hypothetical protein